MQASRTTLLWGGVAALCGGGLLVAKRLWDYFGQGRLRAHTGYQDKDLTDSLFFLVPLLLVAAFAGLWRSVGSTLRVGRVNLGLGLLGGALQSLSEFGEAWASHGVPWGLVGGLGLILMTVGLFWLGLLALRRTGTRSRGLFALLLGSLAPVQMAAVMLPYHIRGDEYFAAKAGLSVAVVSGVSWMLLGYVLCTRTEPNRDQ